MTFAGGGVTLDATGKIINDDALRFDFVKNPADTAAGFKTVEPTSAYSGGTGFGWVNPSAIEKFDTGAGNPDDLQRDYHFFRTGSRTFRADLPDGDYDVTVNIGSALHSFKKVGVFIDGSQVDQITTLPGQFVSPTYNVIVTGGKLELTIERQGGTFVGISGLTIAPSTGVPQVVTSLSTVVYATGDPSTVIDSGVQVSDSDSTNLEGATVRIVSGHVPSEDLLEFTNQLGITGTFVGATGVLTLSGTAPVADYQTALRSVAYRNSSGTPTFATRTIEFEVTDGADFGSDTRDVQVTDPTALLSADFDFVKSAAATAAGFTTVLTTTAYAPGPGFGWVAPSAIEKFDTGAGNPDDLLRDYHFFRVGSRTFRVNVPNGNYDVTFTMGSTLHAFKQAGIIINGTQVDTVTTLAGQFFTQTYQVGVINGRIELTIERQGGTFVSISALSIAPTTPPGPLLAAPDNARPLGPVQNVTEAELQSAVDQAIGVWSSTGLSDSEVAALQSVDVRIANLSGNRLGEATSSLFTIDDDAAGYGWSANGMDLQTVVLHELGHVIGRDDIYDADHADDIMYGHLSPGETRSPQAGTTPLLPSLDTIFSLHDLDDELSLFDLL